MEGKANFLIAFLFAFLVSPSVIFSALLRIQMLFRPRLLPDLLRRIQGESKMEVQSLGGGIRHAGGAARWVTFPHPMPDALEACLVWHLPLQEKTEITKQQRQS